MKLRLLALVVLAMVFVQCAIFTKKTVSDDYDTDNYGALTKQVNAYIEKEDYAAAIPLLKRMHEIRPGELAPVEWLGILYVNLPEEKPEFTNALFWLMEAEKRGSSMGELVYGNLAFIYSSKGEPEKAETAMDKAIALGFSDFEWMNKDDDLANFRTGEWWKGIADNYMLIQQKLAEFKDFISDETEKSIEDRIKFYSGIIISLKELAPTIPALQSRPLSFLAFSYESNDDYFLAEQNYLEAKAVSEKVLGKEHPNYAYLTVNLGRLYYNMGYYEKAESCFLEARDIYEKVHGKEHPDYAITSDNLDSAMNANK